MAHEKITNSLAKYGKSAGSAATKTFHDASFAARRSAHGLNSLAEAVAHDTKDGVWQIMHVVENESSKIIRFIRRSIQDRPTVTVGVAASVGVLIGLTLSGRR